MTGNSKKRDFSPIHPGEMLREVYMPEYGLKPYGLAKALNVSRNRIERLVREEISLTADTALRLSRFFGNSAEMWLNMQRKYDLDVAKIELEGELEQIVPA